MHRPITGKESHIAWRELLEVIVRKWQSMLILVVALSVLGPVAPAGAYQGETGSKNCGSTLTYLHSRYNDSVFASAPGVSSVYHSYSDGNWHVSENNGSYSGTWIAIAYDFLDYGGTWAGCRNYG